MRKTFGKLERKIPYASCDLKLMNRVYHVYNITNRKWIHLNPGTCSCSIFYGRFSFTFKQTSYFFRSNVMATAFRTWTHFIIYRRKIISNNRRQSPAGIYLAKVLLKVNKRNNRTRCGICSKLTIMTSDAISVVMVSLLLILNIFHTLC